MILLFDIDSLLYSSCYNIESAEEAMFKFDENYQKAVNDLEELSKTSSIPDNTGTNVFDPYDATLDIEKIRSLAKQQIINLGIDPTEVGI